MNRVTNQSAQVIRNRYIKNQPQIDGTAFVAESADLIGAVTVGKQASIWYQAVVRADDEPITIGAGTNLQDGTIVHIDPGEPTVLGNYVTVAHGAIVHGARIDDYVMISIGAIVLTGAHIGTNSIIGAGAVVMEGMVVPPNSLLVGIPGRVIKSVTEEQSARIRSTAQVYIERGQRYAALRAKG
jgi:carbonic anhydrase/acetyltransferase-like protein (isoleucine patch superfamily)|tara:strand:- start:207 stop:758 length:552 start_codon:yes stop_codon:yes gene_type:complete